MTNNPYWDIALKAMANQKPKLDPVDRLPPLPVKQKRSRFRMVPSGPSLEIKHIRGHVEVFRYGVFQFSADTEEEARRMLREEDR